jgi:S1-C subfamily serine protease
MQAGDIITSMNGKKVSNIYDYMTRLGELKTGDFVDVEAIREGKEIKIKIKL